jgi:hypothetical protein
MLLSIAVPIAEQALERDGLKGIAFVALITVGVTTVLAAVFASQLTVKVHPSRIEPG